MTRQEAVWEYRPVLSSSLCRYVPFPVPVVQNVPTCVVEEPEDWEREYADTQLSTGVSQVEPQPFQLKEFRSGQRDGILASTIRGLQNLSLQHFSVRDPVLATDGAAQIGSDGYLMSLRRDGMLWW